MAAGDALTPSMAETPGRVWVIVLEEGLTGRREVVLRGAVTADGEIVRKLQAEKQQLTDQLQRKQAEMENLRKRLLKEKEWTTSGHLIELLTPGLIGMVLSCLAGLAALRDLAAAGGWAGKARSSTISAALK